MLPLLNAIYAKFTGDLSLVTAFPGGLHRDRAPEATAMPYLVSHVISSKTESSYGSDTHTETQIRFSAYGVGHDATGSLLQTLIAEFDNGLLALSGGATNDSITRLSDVVPVLHREDAAGNDVWQWSVVYEYAVS
jgi:hypothetical protein